MPLKRGRGPLQKFHAAIGPANSPLDSGGSRPALTPVATVSAGPSPGTLRVPDNALRHGDPVSVLQRHVRHGRATLRELVVSVRGKDTTPRWSIVVDPTDRLEPGTAVHDTSHPAEWLYQIYRNVNAFEDHLAEAPKRLADVRTLLYWTAAMLDAPLCQGDVKRRATEALQQARTYYEAARRQLIEGQTVDAARRIHEALRRISSAAAELARSCGDGQTTLPGAAPILEVTPADKRVLTGAAATMSLPIVRDAAPAEQPRSTLASQAPANLHGGDIRPAEAHLEAHMEGVEPGGFAESRPVTTTEGGGQ